MWKKIQDSGYFLSLVQNHDYELSITNFISVWSTCYSKKAFIAQLKNSNVGLTLENDKKYLDNGLHLLSIGLDNLKLCKLEESGEGLLMTLRTVIEYPFGFDCKFSKGSVEFFFNKVTLPLLETVGDLKSSEQNLIETLIKKEKEVKAYKRELYNKDIIFRHEVTKAFSDVEHRNMYNMYDKNFGPQEIPKNVIQKSIKLPQKPTEHPHVSAVPNIKRKPDNIKLEPHSISDIKQETGNTEEDTTNINSQTSIVTKKEIINVKQEPCTPVFENNISPLIEQSLSVKQEVIKPEPSPRKPNDRRKRLKLSY